MSDFDWYLFLTRYGIDFVSHGPSTAKGNLYIRCPYCGASDHGHHMGVSLQGHGWGCWKSSAHRGKNPVRLIAALLGISHAEAAKIAGVGSRGLPSDPNSALTEMLAQLTGKPDMEPTKLEFPEEFLNRWDSKIAEPFVDYLSGRGFSTDNISSLTEHYQLQFALTGDYRYRVILPIFDLDWSLFSWTGRAINPDAKVRYKTLSNHSTNPPTALGPTSNMLLDLPNVDEGGDFLVVAEGPFDAMKLSLFTEDYQAKATCLFGKRISHAQISLLADLRNSYNDIFVILDPDAATDLLATSSLLTAIDVRVWPLSGDRDPGDMPERAVRKLLSDLSLATKAE